MSDLAQLSIDEFCALLEREGIQRFHLVWDGDQQRVVASHPALQPLADWMGADTRDFDVHEGFFAQIGPRTGVLQGAAVHRTCRGQAAGGVRYWRYDTVEDYIRDGLRLARGMTHKNALAGLWWGGGKGVMASGTGRADAERHDIYAEYGDFMTSLQGCYVTAEDVGTGPDDMLAIFTRTRFTTCIPDYVGGSGNPSRPTALGVVRGMEAGLAHLRMGTLQGKTVAVQGIGHVGAPLVQILAARGVARVIASDIGAGLEAPLRAVVPDLDLEVRIVDRGDNEILFAKADIVSPNATGAILNRDTIGRIQAPIVCGAANNQLADPLTDDRRLKDAGVLYLPDFLVNRMGIVNCADEQAGYISPDPLFERHLGDEWDNSIYRLMLQVLQEATASRRTPAAVAVQMAEQRSLEHNPIYGHRGEAIIASLVRSGWAQGDPGAPAAARLDLP